MGQRSKPAHRHAARVPNSAESPLKGVLTLGLVLGIAGCAGPAVPTFQAPTTPASAAAAQAPRPRIAEVLAKADPLAGVPEMDAAAGSQAPGQGHEGHSGHGGHSTPGAAGAQDEQSGPGGHQGHGGHHGQHRQAPAPSAPPTAR